MSSFISISNPNANTNPEDPRWNNTIASQLFKVKITQLEMLRDRGYDISQELPLFNYRVSDFATYYENLARAQNTTPKRVLSKNYYRPVDTTNSIIPNPPNNVPNNVPNEMSMVYVYYPETPEDRKEFNTSAINEIIALMESNQIKHIILILETGVGNAALKKLNDYPSLKFEIFLYEDLTYNCTKHFLVPKHTLLTKGETMGMLKRNNLKIMELPKIYLNDPIAKYYGANPGHVFRIVRPALFVPTLIKDQIYYRLVLSTNRPNDPPKTN